MKILKRKNNFMEVNELIQKKLVLEADIASLIRNFYKETDIMPDTIIVEKTTTQLTTGKSMISTTVTVKILL